MARIVSPPRDQLGILRTPLTEGEQKVFQLFDRLLPEEWEIYIQPHLNGLRPDFVLINPNIGIAVFEVKDWNLDALQYRFVPGVSGPVLLAQDAQGKEFRIKDEPLRKLRLYEQEILGLYCPRLGIRVAEYFPTKAVVTAGAILMRTTTARARALFRSAREYHDLPPNQYPIAGGDAVARGALAVVFPESRRLASKVMTKEFSEDLRTWLYEPDHAAEQRERLPLDARQRSLVEAEFGAIRHRRIRGPVGSGKSHVLAARAARLASQGLDTLVVTFNITLLNYLRDLAVRYPEPGKGFTNRITWLNFHEWCKRVCFDAGMEDEYRALWRSQSGTDGGPSAPDEWDENLLGLSDADKGQILESRLPKLVGSVLDQASGAGRRYDAVLVDEGQDFNLAWWSVLRKVCRQGGGEMLLVADETQDIYEKASAWTEAAMVGAGFIGPWLRLDTGYRLPTSLVPYLRHYVQRYFRGPVNLPEAVQAELGVELRWLQVTPDAALDACVQAVLDTTTMAGDGHVPFSDVTLLVGSRELGVQCVERLESKNIKVAHVFGEASRERKQAFFMGDARVKVCTIHSFKGWETRALVVHVARGSSVRDHRLNYVALSRLKRSSQGSFCTVVCTAPVLEEYGRTWPSFERWRAPDPSGLQG